MNIDYDERTRAISAELDRLDHWVPLMHEAEKREDFLVLVATVFDIAEAYDARGWTAEQVYDPENWPAPPPYDAPT